MLPEGGGIHLEFHEVPDSRQHVAEQETCPFDGPEQVTDQRKATTLDPAVIDGRSARLIDTPLDLGRFEVGIDFRVNAHELTGSLEIGHTILQVAIAHALCRSPAASPQGCIFEPHRHYQDSGWTAASKRIGLPPQGPTV